MQIPWLLRGLCDRVASRRWHGPGGRVLSHASQQTGETLAALVDPKRPGARSRRSLGIQSRQRISSCQATAGEPGTSGEGGDACGVLRARSTTSSVLPATVRTQQAAAREEQVVVSGPGSSVPRARVVQIDAVGCQANAWYDIVHMIPRTGRVLSKVRGQGGRAFRVVAAIVGHPYAPTCDDLHVNTHLAESRPASSPSRWGCLVRPAPATA